MARWPRATTLRCHIMPHEQPGTVASAGDRDRPTEVEPRRSASAQQWHRCSECSRAAKWRQAGEAFPCSTATLQPYQHLAEAIPVLLGHGRSTSEAPAPRLNPALQETQRAQRAQGQRARRQRAPTLPSARSGPAQDPLMPPDRTRARGGRSGVRGSLPQRVWWASCWTSQATRCPRHPLVSAQQSPVESRLALGVTGDRHFFPAAEPSTCRNSCHPACHLLSQ